MPHSDISNVEKKKQSSKIGISAYYRQRSHEYLQAADRTTQDLAHYIDAPKERELWVAIQERLRALHERPKAPALTAEIQAWPASGLSTLIQDFEVQSETQMEQSIQAAEHLRETVSHWTLGLSLGTAVLLLGGALGFVRRVIRPALSETRAAEAFGRGDFSVRTPVLHDDELGALARTFNNMAGDIADREKDRLQFVAMVVHGRFSIRKTEVDLGALVRQFVEAQSKAFATHEITVATDEGCTIQADAAMPTTTKLAGCGTAHGHKRRSRSPGTPLTIPPRAANPRSRAWPRIRWLPSLKNSGNHPTRCPTDIRFDLAILVPRMGAPTGGHRTILGKNRLLSTQMENTRSDGSRLLQTDDGTATNLSSFGGK